MNSFARPCSSRTAARTSASSASRPVTLSRSRIISPRLLPAPITHGRVASVPPNGFHPRPRGHLPGGSDDLRSRAVSELLPALGKRPGRAADCDDRGRRLTEKGTRMGLAGRGRTVHALLRTVTAPAEAPLTIVGGRPGLGRTSVLNALHDELFERGTPTATLRFHRGAPAESPRAPATGSPAVTMVSGTAWPVTGSTTGAHDSPGIARRAASAVADHLIARGAAVLLIDDAQWMDLDNLAVLEAVVRRLAGTSVHCVCTVRTPVPEAIRAAGREAMDRLRADLLVREHVLRPLDKVDITEIVAETLAARPSSGLIDRLWHLSRGTPLALVTALDAYQRADSVHVVDQHAYLTRPRLAELPAGHELLAPITGLGEAAWRAAKAVAVFEPLGPAVPRLVERALGTSPEETLHLLELLREEGVLRFRGGDRSWRFPVPLVAVALLDACGPYERRQLAQLAVTALRSGDARCDDPGYLTDQLANAGRLVDPADAEATLVDRASATMLTDGARADRWLASAADLAGDRARQARIQLARVSGRFAHGDYRGCLAAAETLLGDFAGHLTSGQLDELQIRHVIALYSVGDFEALNDIVSGTHRGKQQVPVVATALALLGRWREAYELVADRAPSGYLETMVRWHAGLVTGRPGHFERSLARPQEWPLRETEQYRYEQISAHVRALLSLGDTTRTEKLLIVEELPADRLHVTEQAVLAMHQGRFDEALELGRAATAAGAALGSGPGQVLVHHAMATILHARGRITGARDLLATAREARPPLPHLLSAPEALLDSTLGEPDEAARRLREGLALASGQGVVLDTDALWWHLTELSILHADHARARTCLAELDHVAEQMGTSRATLHLLLARALVEHDREAASSAVRLAQERGQPFELARVIDTVVRHGVGDPGLLPQSYELFGELDALLYRSWSRDLMRRHDIAVRGRQTTIAENERLLAVLVTEGLGNKQLATVLHSTEKGIEGRLSRLFSRTGYRSRTELAAAMFRGDYPG
ncbi:AAA family ATPase [Amycolatopsis sp. NPDC059021]|uniref:AAA family ATPase n=1 Tax=Amycolatopsis sp. NPDC059021 TaxID=3346704 RepID=UPI00366E8167